jgi:hypothetical protein
VKKSSGIRFWDFGGWGGGGEEAAPPGPLICNWFAIRNFGLGEVLVGDDGGGVGDEEAVGEGGSKFFLDPGTGEVEAGWTAADAVAVAGDEVDVVLFEEAAGEGLDFDAPLSGESGGGDLDEAVLFDPFKEELGALAEDGIAFGVGDDDAESGLFEAVEHFAGIGEDDDIGEFDEEVAGGVEGIAAGVGEGIDEVIVHDVEVTATEESEVGGGGGAGEVEEAVGEIGVEVVAGVGVGGGDEVGGAGGGGDAEHFGGFGFVAGAVVEAREEMAVEVDHGGRGTSLVL